MDLPAYRLNKEGSYYYLCLDRAHGLLTMDPHAHAQAITSALENLGDQSPADAKELQLKMESDINDVKQSELDSKQSDLRQSGQDSKQSDLRQSGQDSKQSDLRQPGQDSKQSDLRQSGPDSKQSDLKHDYKQTDLRQSGQDSRHSELKPKEDEKEREIEAKQAVTSTDVGPMDNSVEIIPPEKEEDNQMTSDMPEADADAFRPEDIRISVIRPSPVKEMHLAAIDLDEVDKDREYLSENTSGSSIQILDDSPLEIHPPQRAELPQVENKEADKETTCETHSEKTKGKRETRSADFERSRSADKADDHVVKDVQRSISEGQVICKGRDDSVFEEADNPGRTLSPLTVMSMDLGSKRSMKRVHSSTSFEKYKVSQPTKTGQGQPRSGRNTPTRKPSGPQTPSRSRHQSGLQTPQSGSVFDTSSRSSVGEEGMSVTYCYVVGKSF